MSILYPLDLIRQKQQVAAKRAADDKAAAAKEGRIWRPKHQSLRETAEAIVSEDGGFLNLYQGLSPTLIAMFLSGLFYFYAYNLIKRIYERKGRMLSVSSNLVVAYVAGLMNACLTSPLWVLAHRVKSQEANTGRMGMIQMLISLVKLEGPSVLFAGLSSSVVLCSNPAIQYMAYERMRLQALNPGQETLAAGVAFVVGALSKAVATVLTYPVQVLQSVTREKNSKGVVSEARRIWEADGPEGFFKGMGPKLLQTVSNAAIMFMCYEKFLALAASLIRFVRVNMARPRSRKLI